MTRSGKVSGSTTSISPEVGLTPEGAWMFAPCARRRSTDGTLLVVTSCLSWGGLRRHSLLWNGSAAPFASPTSARRLLVIQEDRPCEELLLIGALSSARRKGIRVHMFESRNVGSAWRSAEIAACASSMRPAKALLAAATRCPARKCGWLRMAARAHDAASP